MTALLDPDSTDLAIARIAQLRGRAQYMHALQLIEARAHALGVPLSKLEAIAVSGAHLTLTMVRDSWRCLAVERIDGLEGRRLP
jgi:hypothetical protein